MQARFAPVGCSESIAVLVGCYRMSCIISASRLSSTMRRVYAVRPQEIDKQ